MVSGEKSRERSAEFRKWPESSAEMRRKHNLPATGAAWTSLSSVQLCGVPRRDRIKDVLNVCFSVWRARHPTLDHRSLIANLWCNVGQSVSRLPISQGLNTGATSALMYSFEKDRLLSGAACMQLLGWPVGLLPRDSFTDRQYRQLAGNGFSLPVACAFTVVLYSNPWAPWW